MRTMRKINKPVRFFGLSSIQFGLFMLANAIIIIVCIFKRLHPLLIVSVLSLIIFISGIFFRKLKREHKAGNPDYIKGLSVANGTPKKITDRKHVFQFIFNNNTQE